MEGGFSGVGYGLKYQARCISDVKADADHTSFLAGIISLDEENEVHLIRLSSGGTELICEGLFSHPNEIWDPSGCPFDQRIFCTVFSTGESYGAAIWRIPELYGQLNSPQLERIAALDAHVADESGIHLWDLRMLKDLSKGSVDTHWTWAVSCNPEYNGLILSAGTDSIVNLWLASTSNRDKLPSASLVESPTRRADPLLHSYSDSEDTVFVLAWSSRELWIFASLSYDGRVVVEC